MAISKKVGNMPSKLWISAQTGTCALFLIVILSNTGINGQVSSLRRSGSDDDDGSFPATTISSVLMNDILFKNLSESFSTKELEDAMISLNRTKRQSLNLLQLAQLAGLSANNNAAAVNAAAATATLPIQQNISNNNGATKQSSEGLLASCQLTNLLLYQLMQQRQQAAAAVTNPFLSLANGNLQGLGSNLNLNIAAAAGTPGSLINPFPAINQNLIFPAQTLATYTTTTTFVTKLTTTAVLTIPLLFGNKPVPTTITRTKTYDVTTSEVQTLTSTVRPTFVTQAIAATPALQDPSPSSSLTLNDVDEDIHSLLPETTSAKKFGGSKPALLEYEDDEPIPSNSRLPTTGTGTTSRLHSKLSKNPSRSGEPSTKRRKPSRSSSSQSQKASPFTTSSNSRGSSTRDRDYQDQTSSRYGSTTGTGKERDDYYETDYQPYAAQTSAKKGTPSTSNSRTSGSGTTFSKRKYGNIYEDDVAVDEDPAAAQYPDDYSYYTRRLKRGEQYGDEGEYLLEPSTDGDFSNNYQKYERCPPIPKGADAQTVTVTRTETKTITKFLGQSTLSSNVNLNRASASYDAPSSSRKRSRTRNRSGSTNNQSSSAHASPAPTPEGRALSSGTTEDTRAQILSRSRSRYNSNTNNNNNNYQQPNYDYYRG